MAKQIYSTRSVTHGKIVKTYSKSFDMSPSGIRNSEKYESNTSKRAVPEEILNCIIDKTLKKIKVYTSADFPVSFFNVEGISSLAKLKGTYNTSGSFYKGFGNIILEILKLFPNLIDFKIDFSNSAKTKLLKL